MSLLKVCVAINGTGCTCPFGNPPFPLSQKSPAVGLSGAAGGYQACVRDGGGYIYIYIYIYIYMWLQEGHDEFMRARMRIVCAQLHNAP